MKVVYLNYLYDLKESSIGAGVHILELSKALRGCGHTVKNYYLNRYTSVEASLQSRVRSIIKKKLWRYFNQFNALFANGRYFIKEWRIITRERPDILLVRYNLLNFSFALAARIKRIPYILEVNAPVAYENRHFSKHVIRLSFIAELLEKFVLKMADHVYVVSQELKSYYVRWHIASSKIHVIPNGVNVKNIHPDISSDDIVTKYHLKGKIVVGFVGSFHCWHGVGNLIQFIRMILTQSQDVVFLLVGEGPLKDELMSQIKSEKIDQWVFFPGYVSHDEIPKYLTAMDIALAPYPKLNFFYYSPLKIFEYLAAGLSIVASRIGQIKEIIQDGKNGILFEPDNMDEFVKKTLKLIENKELRENLARQGRQILEEKFAWDHTAEKISHLIHSIKD